MGFFDIRDNYRGAMGDVELLRWCRQLSKATEGVRTRYRKGAHLIQWCRDLRTLRKARGPVLVEQALNWFCEHIGEPFTPSIGSAATFAKKFDQVLAQMEKDSGGFVASSSSSDIPDGILRRANELGDEFTWPIEVRPCIASIFYKSKLGWLEFLSTTNKNKNTFSERERAFLERVFRQEAYFFPHNWMIFLGKKLGSLEHYYGPVGSLVWTIGSIWFLESFWREWSMSYTSDPTAFDDLYQTLKKGEK